MAYFLRRFLGIRLPSREISVKIMRGNRVRYEPYGDDEWSGITSGWQVVDDGTVDVMKFYHRGREIHPCELARLARASNWVHLDREIRRLCNRAEGHLTSEAGFSSVISEEWRDTKAEFLLSIVSGTKKGLQLNHAHAGTATVFHNQVTLDHHAAGGKAEMERYEDFDGLVIEYKLIISVQ